MQSFLHLKWLLVKRYFSAYLAFYIAFLVSITSLVLLLYSPVSNGINDEETKEMAAAVLLLASVASVAVLALKNLFLAVYSFLQYLRAAQNLVELVMLCFCGTFLAVHQFGDREAAGGAVIHLAAGSTVPRSC